jgi:predicted ester cyclase
MCASASVDCWLESVSAFPWSSSSDSLYQQNSKIGSHSESSTGELAVTRDEARNLADLWVAAWNAHDLDLIMTHYDDAVELTSPVAAQLLKTSDGKVIGKANLRAYFQRGLEAYPELSFHLEDVLCGVNSVVFYYKNQKGTRTAEFMELSATGKVARVVANYGT